jgi:hypothetical protein
MDDTANKPVDPMAPATDTSTPVMGDTGTTQTPAPAYQDPTTTTVPTDAPVTGGTPVAETPVVSPDAPAVPAAEEKPEGMPPAGAPPMPAA